MILLPFTTVVEVEMDFMLTDRGNPDPPIDVNLKQTGGVAKQRFNKNLCLYTVDTNAPTATRKKP